MLEAPKLQHVTITVDSDAIAILKLNRPTALNALNIPLIEDLLAALRWAEAAVSIRIIILAGEGRTFTAGLDLLDENLRDGDAMVSDRFVDALGSVQECLINSNKILISAVQGPAPGWGTSSLALSDLVYATPNSYFFTPFVQWGLCTEACSSQALSQIMGRQRASGLILAGGKLTAQDLKAAGMITEILDCEGFVDSVLGVARSIAKLPAESLATNKSLMMFGTREKLLETSRREMTEFKRLARGKECREAVASFERNQNEKKRNVKSKM